jgi:hypothetical protein
MIDGWCCGNLGLIVWGQQTGAYFFNWALTTPPFYHKIVDFLAQKIAPPLWSNKKSTLKYFFPWDLSLNVSCR